MRIKKRLGLLKNKDGATAVEFALVAPIFFALIFSILEAGWFFFVQSAVEQANANAARLIRTGQAQGGITKEAFYEEICRVVKKFGSCDDRLTIDISNYADFSTLAADLTAPTCKDPDDPSIQGAQFDQSNYGNQRDIVRVRVCFLYKPINPAIGLNLANDSNGNRKLVSVSIFRNEPFDS